MTGSLPDHCWTLMLDPVRSGPEQRSLLQYPLEDYPALCKAQDVQVPKTGLCLPWASI